MLAQPAQSGRCGLGSRIVIRIEVPDDGRHRVIDGFSGVCGSLTSLGIQKRIRDGHQAPNGVQHGNLMLLLTANGLPRSDKCVFPLPERPDRLVGPTIGDKAPDGANQRAERGLYRFVTLA